MKYGAIDIGTNSVRLLTCTKEDDTLLNRVKHVNMTRIGKDVDKTGRLNEARIEATVQVLETYKKILLKEDIAHCPVFATSAVRDAENRSDFLDLVKARTDFDVSVISGDEEAKYGFLGVVKGAKVDAQNIMVIDIGGGSTELIYGSMSGDIYYAHSFDMGAVRLTDRFKLGHHHTVEDFDEVRRLVHKMLGAEGVRGIVKMPIACIGIGGTATTIGAIDLSLCPYDSERIQNYSIDSNVVSDITKKLITSTRAEKETFIGLNPNRADIISAGAVILETILNYFESECLYFSDYDNLEGSVFSAL